MAKGIWWWAAPWDWHPTMPLQGAGMLGLRVFPVHQLSALAHPKLGKVGLCS